MGAADRWHLDVGHVEGARYAQEWVRDPAVRSVMDAEARALSTADVRRLTEPLQQVPSAHWGLARLLSGEAAASLCAASEDS